MYFQKATSTIGIWLTKATLFAFVWIPPLHAELLQEKPLSKTKLSNHYSPRFMRLMQIVFGNDEILSQGGYESVDVLFGSFDFNNKKVLDVGSGFGGVDIYLAQQFALNIIGVDLEVFMTKMAEHFLEQHKDSLVGQISFQTLIEPTSLSEFDENTFDVAFSKETFYHVQREDKKNYLLEIFRVLKPGGTLFIADWFQSSETEGPYIKKAATDPTACQFATPETFLASLKEIDFQSITYIDQTDKHIRYTNEDLMRINKNADLIRQEIGEDALSATLRDWQYWLEAQEAGELLSGIIICSKPQTR